MGIRYLNQYLKEHCPTSIECISLAKLSGKKIVVDTSIYLYKYETEDMLLENMYVLLSILRYYNIIAVFIFDGKPPIEKKPVLIQRINDRKIAQVEYQKLEDKLNIVEDEDKRDIIDSMDQLKRKLVHITKEKIAKVKELITYFGSSYYDAPGEADEMCALLMHTKMVWACLSEDMDMFVYGCERVLRYFSLMNHTVVLYNMKGILHELNWSQNEFREICVLSGTDYNPTNASLFQIITYFKKYRADPQKRDQTFYMWLKQDVDINLKIEIDVESLNKISNMFDLKTRGQDKIIDSTKIKIVNTPIQYKGLADILKSDGFIFV